MPVFLRHAVLCVLLLALAACASVPISTMWRMRNFGPEQLAALDPDNLRVATTLEPAHLRVDPAKARLVLTLVPRAGGADEVYTLQLREAAVANDDLVPDDGAQWQMFRLAADSADTLRAALPRITRDMQADYASASFKVNFGFAGERQLDGLDAVHASVRLALAADQSAFTLVDGARIPVDKTAPAAP